MNALLCITLVAGFQTKVAVPPGIHAIYQRQSAQVRKGDWKGFFATYDPKFVYTDPSGKRFSLSEFKKETLKMFVPAEKRGAKMTYTAAKTSGDTARISYVCDFTLTTKRSTKVYREIATDTWRKTPSGWLETSCVDKSFDELKRK